MALSFEAVTRGPSRPCPALGLKRALFSEPSREDGAAGAKVPDPASWKHAPRTFMTSAGRSCSGPGCFCFREESAEVAKGRGPVACLFLRSFCSGRRKAFAGRSCRRGAPRRPSRLSQRPHTLVWVLLFASAKCGAFQKTSNFLCCYSVAIVN